MKVRHLVVLSTVLLVAGCQQVPPLHPDPASDAAPLEGQAVRLPESTSSGRPFSTLLSGAEEVPGPGDPDGSGRVRMTLNYGRAEICVELRVTNIAPATAAHIHLGEAGTAGPVVVTLETPTSGFAAGCVTVDAEVVRAIRQNPSAYYVNVHNAEFPAGAIRGQLSK